MHFSLLNLPPGSSHYHHTRGWACMRWGAYVGGMTMCDVWGGTWRPSGVLGPPPMQGLPSLTSTGTATRLGDGIGFTLCWSWRPFSCWARFVLYLKGMRKRGEEELNTSVTP